MIYRIISICIITAVVGCNKNTPPEKLPIIGHREINDGDTIYPTVRPFEFVNQDSTVVTNETFSDGIYVVSFFFTSCPTVCPKISQQMLRVYDKYLDNEQVRLASFTVDPKRDTAERLKRYADDLEVKSPKWQFITGDKDSLHTIDADYMSIALENPDAPGGFDHSGRIILVDKIGQVRAFCNGLEPEEVTRFLGEIDILLNEI